MNSKRMSFHLCTLWLKWMARTSPKEVTVFYKLSPHPAVLVLAPRAGSKHRGLCAVEDAKCLYNTLAPSSPEPVTQHLEIQSLA